MGNKISNNNNPINNPLHDVNNNVVNNNDLQVDLLSTINSIATKYILTMNTLDLIKMSDDEYAKHMMILTSNIFNTQLTDTEIGFMNAKITEPGKLIDKNNIHLYVPKNKKQRKQYIKVISMYYMKIITVFCSIVSTLNPQYSYKDEKNITKDFYLKDYKSYMNLPLDAKPVLIQTANPFNHHNMRLNILNMNVFKKEDKVTLGLGKQICSPTSLKLNDHISLNELDALYNDVFDLETKTWSKKSSVMMDKYNNDLDKMYTIFTGNTVRPEYITSFYDIEMMDFSKSTMCNEASFKENLVIDKDNALLQKYLELIKKIQDITKKQNDKLNSVLNELFVKHNDSYIINPILSMDKLILIESKVKKIILNMYVKCEELFIKALLVYEDIYIDKYNELKQLSTPPESMPTVPPPAPPESMPTVPPPTPPETTPPETTPPETTPAPPESMPTVPPPTPPETTPPESAPPVSPPIMSPTAPPVPPPIMSPTAPPVSPPIMSPATPPPTRPVTNPVSTQGTTTNPMTYSVTPMSTIEQHQTY